jgi:hypothetical protein
MGSEIVGCGHDAVWNTKHRQESRWQPHEASVSHVWKAEKLAPQCLQNTSCMRGHLRPLRTTNVEPYNSNSLDQKGKNLRQDRT